MNFIYSKAFMIRSQQLDIAKSCPVEINKLNIEIERIGIVIINKPKYQPVHKWERRQPAPVPIRTKPIINQLPPDLKRITGILNKISDDNYDKMIAEAKTFNYASPEVVGIIFKKIMAEPFFSDLYAQLCKSLENLREVINEKCLIEFNKNKHKNLGKFIGELYKLGILDDINSFVDTLLDNMGEQELETLCKIITTIGAKNKMFSEIIKYLDTIKSNFSARYKFMIMDLVDGSQ